MTGFEMFGMWLTGYTIAFCALPLGLCFEWHKKRSSGNYSAFNFVCIVVSISMWLRYAFLTGDTLQQIVNASTFSLFSFYLVVYALYQRDRSTLVVQVSAAAAIVVGLLLYVERLPSGPAKTAEMGMVAGSVQTATFAGLLYEIVRVFQMRTTEYIPFNMTAGGIFLQAQYWFYAYVLGDVYMRRANEVGLGINAVVCVLYVVFPPQTWKVPIIGTGGTHVHKKEL